MKPFLIYIDAIAVAVVLKTDTDAAFACAFKRYPKARDIGIGAVKADDILAALSDILTTLVAVEYDVNGSFSLGFGGWIWPRGYCAEVTHVANGLVFIRYFAGTPGLTSFNPTN